MTTPLAYGIDFGTTNSAVSVAWDDGSITVVDPDSSHTIPDVMPSIAYLDRTGVATVGSAAVERFLVTGADKHVCRRCDLVQVVGDVLDSECRQFTPGGGCNDARLIGGIKGELADPGFTHTHSWARDFSIEDLTALVLRHLKQAADRDTGADVRRAVVGYPIVFAAAEGEDYEERQLLGRIRLEDAARRAGFDYVELFPEPAAAVMDEVADDGMVAAVDFGGGTFDCAVMAVDDGVAEVVGLSGVAVGGEVFDRLLFEDLMEVPLGLDTTEPSGRPIYPRWFRHRLATLGGVKHLLADNTTYEVLKGVRSVGLPTDALDAVLFGGQAHAFYRTVESTKIALSERETVHFDFRRPGIELTFPVERDRFERLISPYLDEVFDTVSAALAQADVEADQVGVVVRTGGSSEIPAFQDRLDRLFPNAEIRARAPFTAVVTGMAVYAQEEWGHV